MNVPRETIAAAFAGLFDALGGGLPFTTISRVIQVPANVSAEMEPALFIVEEDEPVDEKQAYGLAAYEFPFRLLIFGTLPDLGSGVAPGTVLNPLVDAVDNRINRTLLSGSTYLTVQPGERQTLGGLVENCYINGRIMKAEGYLGQHVVAAIPVTIRTGA
jgi:hypothetical protein